MTWVEWVKFGIAVAVLCGVFLGICWAGDYQKREDQE